MVCWTQLVGTAAIADMGIDGLGGCGTTFGLPYVFLSPAPTLLVSAHCTSSVGVSV